jgi:predicted RNase H-like HicB family nuclease
VNRYLIVIEKADGNWGAFAPDLPGCVALGDTVEETMELMREAIDMHLEGMVEDGDAIPEATTLADYIEVEIPTKAKSAPTRPRARKKVPARR